MCSRSGREFDHFRQKSTAMAFRPGQAEDHLDVCLLQAKLGSQSSGLTVILKSWWQPAVTMSLAGTPQEFSAFHVISFNVSLRVFRLQAHRFWPLFCLTYICKDGISFTSFE